ncbi:MAG TPA: hypothetical protein VM286_06070 [Candidatus Thermoplasmatota archaeon]|nr:hypothetical protein [Candidatus Thermoplasmatota archaeon]
MMLLLLLAGCASAPKGVGGPEADAVVGPPRLWMAHPDIRLAADQVPVPAAFAYTGPLNVTKTYTGAFAPQQSCPLGACFMGEQLVDLDISDSLPLGMPLQVTAVLDTAAMLSPPFILPIAPEADRLVDSGSAFDQTTATTRDHFVLHRNVADPVHLWLIRGEPADPSGQFTLTLYVEVQTALFDPLTPLGLKVPDGTTGIAFEEATPGGDVRVWDGKDQMLGTFSLASGFAFLNVSNPGELVLQFTRATAAIHVYAMAPNGTAATLRLLGFERTEGDPHAVTGSEPAEWTFAADRAPLGVGVHVTGTSPVGFPVMVMMQAQLRLKSPIGSTVASHDVPTCVCSINAWLGTWGSTAPAGTYTASFTSAVSAQVQVSSFVEQYVR